MRDELPSGGTLVDLVEPGGRWVGRGYADPESPIAVRLLTVDPAETGSTLEDIVAPRVEAALALRRAAGIDQVTDAYRVLHGENDRLPGVVVDRYGPVAIVEIDTPAAEPIATLAALAVAEALGVRIVSAGEAEPEPLVVTEHGVRFEVRPGAGHKTGLFLDQRENRALFARAAAGRRDLLDVFSYTGGFALHALRAGAARATLVDSAGLALEAARRNAAHNGIAADRLDVVAGDAFERLDAFARAGRRFDAVVLDPPSFAPRESAKKRALSAYRKLNALCLRACAPGAVFATASCSSHVILEEFLAALRDAAAQTRRDLRLLEIRGAGSDHPTLPAFPEGRYLKFVLGTAL